MNQTFIHADKVTKSYNVGKKKVLVLKDVSFKVRKSEFIAILGPSGSGKTTLIHLLSGIDVPDTGTITIDNVVINRMKESERTKWRRRNLGIVFQFFHLIPVLTVIENVMLPMELAGYLDSKARRKRALELLEYVGMKGYENRFPSELSGGEQQRVALARALAVDPPLILADEPTANLDTSNKKRIIEILKSMSEMGKTIVLTTHDLNLASYSDRIIRLVDGVIQEV